MDIIDEDSIYDYDYTSLYYQELQESISGYNFLANPQILIDFIKNNLNIDISKEELETYYDLFDNIYSLFYTTAEEERVTYLVSAFNIYKKYVYEEEYVRDEELTELWRKTMMSAYPKSTYSADLENKLAREKASDVDDIF